METRALAQMGIARILYGLRQDAASAAAYDRVPRGCRVWAESLFERGYPRFRAGDDGGALGTVHATRAPQLQPSFLPEARILEARCCSTPASIPRPRSVLDGFTGAYRPLSERLVALATGAPPPPRRWRCSPTPRTRHTLGWAWDRRWSPSPASPQASICSGRWTPSGPAALGGPRRPCAGAAGAGPHRGRAGHGTGDPRAAGGSLRLAPGSPRAGRRAAASR
jgi:hypothetical protein